jgi:hypothetical protein
MSVRIAVTPFLPEMIGTVVDMPNPDVYVIETKNGFFTIHDSEIVEFFYV